jgi:hypothetical protein
VGFIFIREEIVTWARKKTGVPVIRIWSAAEAEEILKKYHTFVTGLFKKFEVCGFESFQESLGIQLLCLNGTHAFENQHYIERDALSCVEKMLY